MLANKHYPTRLRAVNVHSTTVIWINKSVADWCERFVFVCKVSNDNWLGKILRHQGKPGDRLLLLLLKLVNQ